MNHPAGIQIRPYTVEDAPTVFEAVIESRAELLPWMPWCHPHYAIEETRAWLATQVPAFKEGHAFEFAIQSADGRYLGGCGLNQIDKVNKRANLGYWVRTSATRQGVATTAIELIRTWGFEHTDLIRLEIVVAAENTASRRAAEKSGAAFEGILRNRLVLHGVAHDAAVHSFTRPLPTFIR
jgi:RimJ/RimL family protein N-acetyltransferase